MFSHLPNTRSVPRSPQKLVPLHQLLANLVQLCQTQCTGSLYLVSSEHHAGSFVLNRGQIVGVKYACQQGERALAMMRGLTQVSYRFTEKAIAIADFQSLPKTDEILTLLGWGVEPSAPAHRPSPSQPPPVSPPPVFSPPPVSPPPVSPPPPASPPPSRLSPPPSPLSVPQFATPQLSAPQLSAPQLSAPQFSEQAVSGQAVSEQAVSEQVVSGQVVSEWQVPGPSVKPQQRLEPAQQNALEHLATAYLGPVAKLILHKTLHQTEDLDTVIQHLKQRIRDPQEAACFEQEANQLRQLPKRINPSQLVGDSKHFEGI